jgi:hypothetical protein
VVRWLRRIFSTWQGLAALAVAVALFWLSPVLLRAMDPTAGVFDAGYLQRPLVAAAYFFFAIFCTWVAFQLNFPTMDHWLDSGKFKLAWDQFPNGAQKALALLLVLAFLLVCFLVCLWLVPI